MKDTLDIELLKEAQIPQSFWSLDLKTYFGSEQALAQTKKYVQNFEAVLKHNVSIVFLGEQSTLKTFLVCSILKQALLKGIEAQYVSLDQMADYSFNKDARLTFNQLFGKPKILGIDNFNNHHNKGVKAAALRVLKLRRDEGNPTVIATNLDEEGLVEVFDKEIFSYLHESCIFVPCSVDPVIRELHFKSKLIGIENVD